MFGFLKKKLSEAVESLSGKAKKKAEEKIEEQQEIQTNVSPVQMEQAPQFLEDQSQQIQEQHIEEEPVSIEPVEEETDIVIEDVVPETFKEEPAIPSVEETPAIEVPELEAEPALEEKAVEPEIEAEPEKKSFFKKITEKVVRKVTQKKLSAEDVNPIISDIEGSLIEADVAVEVAEKIGGDLRTALVDQEIKRGKEKDVIVETFRKSMLEILDVPSVDFEDMLREKKPVVIAFWGFNGAGKTTSLAKTASWLVGKGHTCVLAAADTFRAGAEEQLGIHGSNIGLKVVKHNYGADPAAVIFDAVEHAKAKGLDFVLADTAGRAHTNTDLMDQMKKIMRVNKPDLKILVIDSLTGNDAVLQARMYGEVGVDAVIFTKIDVNEKGGAILSVTHELKKPILFLGMGQNYEDFQEFDARKFVDNILD